MKNNQLEVLTNITHDITNQFSLKRIDEDVLFHSIIAYDNLGVINLFGGLGVEVKQLVTSSNKLLSEKEKGQPLFSSHMLDLSEEPLEENIETSAQFYKRMAPLGMSIEIELGVTGGEEDGVDNSDVENDKLYTQPQHVAHAFEVLRKIGDLFTVAAAFGNVHGVYSPGNVQLRPEILKNSQDYIQQHFNTGEKPVFFVFHGGSGSPQHQIREAIGYGAIKMNIDTDLQWAFWEGVLHNYKKNEAYLQTQLGNPEGAEKPNKKYYDPRVWLRKGEETFMARLKTAFEDLNCINRNA